MSQFHVDRKTYTFTDETKVTFIELDDALIDMYVASGDPLDKAGAYGIQSGGALFVEEIEGDYYSVMGLPICRTNKTFTYAWNSLSERRWRE